MLSIRNRKKKIRFESIVARLGMKSWMEGILSCGYVERLDRYGAVKFHIWLRGSHLNLSRINWGIIHSRYWDS